MGTWAVALVIALSPFALIPAVLLLLADNPRRLALAFLAGWSGGLLVLTSVAVGLADVVEAWQAPEWIVWIRGVVGVVLIGLGLRGLLSRGSSDGSGWASRLIGITARKALSLGLLLVLANPKVIALAAAGGIGIGYASSSIVDEAINVVLFAAIASLGVAVPLLTHISAGERAEGWLRSAEGFLERRGNQFMGIVMTLIGVYLLADVVL